MAPDAPARRRPRGAPAGRWRRLPLRIRLIAGFAATMLLVLAGAGAFVYLRVEYALDLRLDGDLAAQSTQLTNLARTGALQRDIAGDNLVPAGVLFQVLDTRNRVLAHSDGLTGQSLLGADQLDGALRRTVHKDRGALLPISNHPLRISATPIHPATTPAAGQPAVVVVAVRRDQRDEALRELIGQLTLANLAALTIASYVGYRLTRAALAPVERYRTQAAEITAGATGIRLAVADGAHDEIARLGHTLNDMLTALDTALATERRFVNDASHELRTPLTLLSTELELALRRPRTTAELERTIRAAAHDTADLIALADTLLSIGTSTQPVADTPVDIGQLVAALVDRYRNTSPDIVIHRRVDPGVNAVADPVRLSRAMTNLLDNAIRHGAGPVTVTVADVDGIAAVSVHDSGPGIDPGFLPHATDRFTRADPARTSSGTGLGLALVDTIVRAHHGELRLCSHGAHLRAVDRGFATECAHPATGTTVTLLLHARPGG